MHRAYDLLPHWGLLADGTCGHSGFVTHPRAVGPPASPSAQQSSRAASARAGAGELTKLVPGLAFVTAGTVAALLLHWFFEKRGWFTGVGTLTIAVVLGIVATNVGVRHASLGPGTRLATAKLLRIGVVLLGLSLSLPAVLALGPAVLAAIVATVAITFTTTRWIGRLLGVSRTQSLLVATGFAVCGASAIAGMQAAVDADEDEVASAIAGVTVFGGACMFALPVLGPALGLSDTQTAVWAGASVHEVAQVVAAAGPLGAAAIATAVVVKLTRVLLLAPLVAGVTLSRRRSATRAGRDEAPAAGARRPPVIPLFVAGFVVCVGVRSAGLLPTSLLEIARWGQDLALTAALFGLGAAVDLPRLVRTGARTATLGLAATLVALVVGLAGASLAVS